MLCCPTVLNNRLYYEPLLASLHVTIYENRFEMIYIMSYKVACMCIYSTYFTYFGILCAQLQSKLKFKQSFNCNSLVLTRSNFVWTVMIVPITALL
jgi:hypothetical protein